MVGAVQKQGWVFASELQCSKKKRFRIPEHPGRLFGEGGYKTMAAASSRTSTWRSGRPRRTSAMRYADPQGGGVSEESAARGLQRPPGKNEVNCLQANPPRNFKKGSGPGTKQSHGTYPPPLCRQPFCNMFSPHGACATRKNEGKMGKCDMGQSLAPPSVPVYGGCLCRGGYIRVDGVKGGHP